MATPCRARRRFKRSLRGRVGFPTAWRSAGRRSGAPAFRRARWSPIARFERRRQSRPAGPALRAREGEADAMRLAKMVGLAALAACCAASASAQAPDYSGKWLFSGLVLSGRIALSFAQVCDLAQTGSQFAGLCRGPNGGCSVVGVVNGGEVDLTCRLNNAADPGAVGRRDLSRRRRARLGRPGNLRPFQGARSDGPGGDDAPLEAERSAPMSPRRRRREKARKGEKRDASATLKRTKKELAHENKACT